MGMLRRRTVIGFLAMVAGSFLLLWVYMVYSVQLSGSWEHLTRDVGVHKPRRLADLKERVLGSYPFDPPPPARLVQGERLKWRTVAKLSNLRIGKKQLNSSDGGILGADFDGDGEDELLWLAYDVGFKSKLYELDGTSKALYLNERLMGATVWDWNRDGIAELIPIVSELFSGEILRTAGLDSGFDTEGSLVICDVEGRVLKAVEAGLEPLSATLTADLDGDGFEELIAFAKSAGQTQLIAFGKDATIARQFPIDGGWFFSAGNFDEDSQVEFLQFRMEEREIIIEQDGSQRKLPGIRQTLPSGTFDLNGDGIDEIFNPIYGLYDCAANELKQFVPKIEGIGGEGRFICGDLNRDGKNELATYEPPFGTALVIHDVERNKIYEEEMGDAILSLHEARSKEGKHLVVHLWGEILIYP